MKRNGFTILELLIAILIIGFATTSMLAWTAALRQMSYIESLGASAVAMAQFKLEEMMALQFDELEQENFQYPEIDLVLDSRGSQSDNDDILADRAVIINDIGTSDVPLKEIIVRVTYRVANDDYVEELRTWISVAG